MTKYKVYVDKYDNLYSDGVSRHFGENLSVVEENEVYLSCVMPLKVDPEECGMVEVGYIEKNDG